MLKLKIAFLCDRLGPYHVARLNAASTYAEIFAIEFSATDQTYEWDLVATPSTFRRVTLFIDNPINSQPIKIVQKRVIQVLNEVKPDVVAIPGWDAPASLIALSWCLSHNIPSVLMSDSQQHDGKRYFWKEFVKNKIVKLHSSGFVAGSNHIDYLKFLGMPEANIVTGLDVVDNNFFIDGANKSNARETDLRKKLALPEKYFLSSSRFIEKKNIFTLLKAYKKYLKKNIKNYWQLVILGDGELRSKLISYRDELGLGDNVIFAGFKQYNELPPYYGLAEVFIHASTIEQWGLVINEAMACGLPVIVSSHCGCAPELVKSGINGFIFDPYDSDELAAHMHYISSDLCDRIDMGKSSSEIISFWSLEVFALSLVAAAKKALKNNVQRFNIINKLILFLLINRYRS